MENAPWHRYAASGNVAVCLKTDTDFLVLVLGCVVLCQLLAPGPGVKVVSRPYLRTFGGSMFAFVCG